MTSDLEWLEIAGGEYEITADGYVRNVNWANLQQISVRHPAAGDSKQDRSPIDSLLHGESSVNVHRDTDAENEQIRAIANTAQNLSLRALETR